jgi:hypothetical protein
MVTALPHQRWVTLERSAPGGGACQYTTPPRHRRRRRTAGGFQRDPAAWDPERLNACFARSRGFPSVHHRTCTRPQRRLAHCQAEPVNWNSTVVPGFTLHPAIKDTCSPGSLSKHGFMPPLFCIFCAAVHDMTRPRSLHLPRRGIRGIVRPGADEAGDRREPHQLSFLQWTTRGSRQETKYEEVEKERTVNIVQRPGKIKVVLSLSLRKTWGSLVERCRISEPSVDFMPCLQERGLSVPPP